MTGLWAPLAVRTSFSDRWAVLPSRRRSGRGCALMDLSRSSREDRPLDRHLAGGVPGSATAGARRHAVDPRHLGRGELRLDLTAPGSGGLDGGHGSLVALARLLHLRRQYRVGLLGLGQHPGRPRGRVLGLSQLDQGAEQIGEIVAAHAALRSLAIADLATPTLPSSNGPRSSILTISTSPTPPPPRPAPSRPTCPRSSSAMRSTAGADGSAGERLPGRGPVPFMPAATGTAALAASASRVAARPCSTPSVRARVSASSISHTGGLPGQPQ